jgi:hypothetical protein
MESSFNVETDNFLPEPFIPFSPSLNEHMDPNYNPPLPSLNEHMDANYNPPMPSLNEHTDANYNPPMPSLNEHMDANYNPPLPSLNDSIETIKEDEPQNTETTEEPQPTPSLNEAIETPELNTVFNDSIETTKEEEPQPSPVFNDSIETTKEEDPLQTTPSLNDSIEHTKEENIKFEIITPIESVGIDELVFKTDPTPPAKTSEYNPDAPPKVIFIVPYRDREEEKAFFEKQMSQVMEDYPQSYYKTYYIQQNHEKPFNRGAMKNIGFIMVKEKYPLQYKDITLVFNDVDTTPANKTTIPDYSTTHGTIKHFYGYRYVLGGIASITAGDFERMNGFPNYYSWGFEDNNLKERADKLNITIDRGVFYPIHDNVNIIQLKQPPDRTVNSGEFDRYIRRVNEGINTIYDLKYIVDENTGMVDVTTFKTNYEVNSSLDRKHDSSKSIIPFTTGYSAKKRCSMNLIF